MKKHHVLIWITLFAIAMGIFEGAVVVYIRALYYPEGFDFPLRLMSNQVAITEVIRELASLLMLLSVGVIAGKNFSQRFAWFIYSFAVWDIIYYVFLYLILTWPSSLLTWDVLFLLPVTWTGPVITPVIISLLMILLAMIIYTGNIKTDNKLIISKLEWILLISGSFVVFISFIWDYCRFIIQNLDRIAYREQSFSERIYNLSFQYIPVRFPWLIFILGASIILTGIIFISRRNTKSS
ncbi:MAG: hypothetical protein RBT49_16455 [Bacteroidales bacterium]|jgi:hypothetical protein|nr:hypothetical protein [Bacteroidales bacterium]